MNDRRVFERITAKLPVRFLDTVNGYEGSAQTFDVSANGIGITATEGLSCNTRLELWLNIPDQHEPIYTRGEVVWSTGSRIGVQLEKAELMGLARVLWLRDKQNP